MHLKLRKFYEIISFHDKKVWILQNHFNLWQDFSQMISASYDNFCQLGWKAFPLLPHSVQLGNFSSAWNLANLQVRPQRGCKMYVGPPPPPPAASIILLLPWKLGSWNLLGVLLVSKGCLEDIRRVSRRCLEGVGRVSGRCLEGVWKLSKGYLEVAWRVSERSLEGVWKVYQVR